MKVFAETGTRGATTRRIAQEAGVNEVTLFRHFRSKDDLLHEAFQLFAREATAPTLPETPEDPRAELIAWCRSRHRALHKVRALIRRSMAEFTDGSTIAQLSMPDMRLPIGYALAYPARIGTAFGRIDWSSLRRLDFEPPDTATFRCLPLAYAAGRTGGTAPAWLSAANEVAVDAFLAGRIRWPQIADVCDATLQRHDGGESSTVQHIIDAERVFAYRALRLSRMDPTPLPAWDQDQWCLHDGANERRWKDLLEEFRAVRESTQYLFDALSDEQLRFVGTVREKPLNAFTLGFVLPGHVAHHLLILEERYL